MLKNMILLIPINEKHISNTNVVLCNIKRIYLHCVFHGIRFKVNNGDWLS